MPKLHFLVFLPLVAFLSCNTTGPIEGKSSISLSIDDVSCTEAWLRIKTSNISLPKNVTIFKDNQVLQTVNLVKSDTLLYFESLQCNRNYSFRCITQKNFETITSEEISLQTLDTTSNNISWQTFVLGSSTIQSTFDDVQIIDDENIWVTGALFQNDSLGNLDTDIYNLIKWNGINWKSERVYYYDHYGSKNLSEISSLFVFNENDIWLGDYTHWNGSKFISVDLNIPLPYYILRSWGYSFNNFYIVGNSGMIASHLQNNWVKIESGTTDNITDIWGADGLIYCASNHEIIQIKDNISGILEIHPEWYIGSVWFKNSNKLFASGSGVFEKSNNKWKTTNTENYNIQMIRGIDYNNIFGISTGGMITHYNGNTWTNFTMPNGATYRSVAVKGKTVVCVGDNSIFGVITIGEMN
jgi:hypothetical protein